MDCNGCTASLTVNSSSYCGFAIFLCYSVDRNCAYISLVFYQQCIVLPSILMRAGSRQNLLITPTIPVFAQPTWHQSRLEKRELRSHSQILITDKSGNLRQLQFSRHIVVLKWPSLVCSGLRPAPLLVDSASSYLTSRSSRLRSSKTEISKLRK